MQQSHPQAEAYGALDDSALRRSASLSPQSILWILIGIYLCAVLRTAWLSDDAYNTFRTVDNFLNGYGLRWNISERVQVYTHPLWMLVLVPAVALTGEVFFSSLTLSIVVSLGSVYLLASRISTSVVAGSITLAAALSSRSFVDYSTSGLENPLTHLIIALYYWCYFSNVKRKGALLSLLLALGILTRHDLLLLLLPPLLLFLWDNRSKEAMIGCAVGALPFVAWTLFSLVYYGYPFPNTAYAKLNTGIPTGELFRQGLLYLYSSVEHDPITPACIAAAVAVAFAGRSRREIALAAGIVLYVIYTVRVGADFMEGRFFSAPFFAGLCLISRVRFSEASTVAISSVAIAVLTLAGRGAPILCRSDYSNSEVRPYFIQDERGVYYPHTGLMRIHHRDQSMPRDHRWAEEGKADHGQRKVVARGAVGFYGYFAGPRVHVIDIYALGEPLLARLPISNPEAWQPGHYLRWPLPKGYEASVTRNRNLVEEPKLRELYDHVRRVTRGRLFSWERFRSIWVLNTSAYKGYIPEQWWKTEVGSFQSAEAGSIK